MGLNPMTCSYKKRETWTEVLRKKATIGQRLRLELCMYKTGATKDCWQPLEAGKRQGKITP